MAGDDDKTKMYKIQNENTEKNIKESGNEETKKMKNTKKTKKEKKSKKQKKHPKLRLFIKIFIILIILLCLAGAGVFAAIFFGDTWDISKDDLVIKMQNSYTYDKDGKLLHELAGEENRQVISLAEMGEYIPKAFVAIEDERFYEHSGIDLKRTAGAIVTYILNGGSSSFGGSTITQQLVKNLLKDNEDSIERKIREWSRAYKVEQMLSKSQILELYLNEIFMGGTVYGVESAANYYFDKSADELSLAESAFLAGINHSPNYYNPFDRDDNKDDIKSRTKTVLGQMLTVTDENGQTFINQEQYDEAIKEVDEGLAFKEGKFSETSDLSFLEVEAINEVIDDMMEEYDMDEAAAKARVYNNGYKIYTTQDSDIQDRMEEEYLKDKYIVDATNPKAEKGSHSQSAMVIIDNENGQVVGCVGGLGDDSPTYGYNRAMSEELQQGSAFKPLAAIAPALENNIVTASTVYDDSPTSFGGVQYGNSTGYLGLITVRKAIQNSSNIVNMKIIIDLGFENSIEFLHEIGMPQFNDDDAMATLALGGATHGSSPLQMAAGYAMIANKGVYREPTFYTKVEDLDGNIILETTQEEKRVMSEANAYVLADILKSPVEGGTAWRCAISGMDVAAKTGTTSEYMDRWLCGFTPYYTGATWFGFDTREEINVDGMDNPSVFIWSAIMDDIHEDLDGKRFEEPDNIVSAKICLDSGKRATKECTHTYTEIFVEGTVPDECDGHKTVKICKETGKLATEYCPETEEKTYLSTPEKEINPSWKTNAGDKYEEIDETCDKHTEETMTLKVENVIGMIQSEARRALSGFNIKITYKTDTSQPDGVILEQSVKAGTKLKKGETITLTINDLHTDEPEEPEEPETPGGDDEEPDPDPNTNEISGNTNEIENTNDTVET